jgi:hypothetical protein
MLQRMPEKKSELYLLCNVQEINSANLLLTDNLINTFSRRSVHSIKTKFPLPKHKISLYAR